MREYVYQVHFSGKDVSRRAMIALLGLAISFGRRQVLEALRGELQWNVRVHHLNLDRPQVASAGGVAVLGRVRSLRLLTRRNL